MILLYNPLNYLTPSDNVARAIYGDQVSRNDDLMDADLTDEGKIQAEMAHGLWNEELKFGIPLPQKLYCSPLTRALRTHLITFGGIDFKSKPKTIILEVWICYYLYI